MMQEWTCDLCGKTAYVGLVHYCEVRYGKGAMAKKDGGPAYPTNLNSGPDYIAPERVYGMTLRDWFAGQALVTLAAVWAPAQGEDYRTTSVAARHAYALADAMLSEREK